MWPKIRPFAAFATASQLAERIDASSATVVQLALTLGFNGYGEFQQNVRHGYLRTLHPMEVLQRQPQDGRNLFETQLYHDIENLRRTLESLHTGLLTDVARRIDSAVETVIISSGKALRPVFLYPIFFWRRGLLPLAFP
jgi:DNA-binding MurR/RpiR family transcriptional regulator